ncbi:MAG: F0F1 ATP synthase subunit epsilon [Armatimonadota bacterium]|nr:F0F1 ATP synthase subunit epsilon [Armatimonadota bacterium]
MAGRTFRLEIVTPERVVIADDTITSVVAPGSEGYLGVMANHAPLLTELMVGQVDIRRSDDSETGVATSGGFMEVSANRVIILADTAELAEEIDITRAEEAKRRAEVRLSRRNEDEVDSARAETAVSRAMNRLHVVEHFRR